MMIVCKIRQNCYCEQSPPPSRKAELRAGRRYGVQARRPAKAGPLAMSTFFRIPEELLKGLF
jgi:hypothetical protein